MLTGREGYLYLLTTLTYFNWVLINISISQRSRPRLFGLLRSPL